MIESLVELRDDIDAMLWYMDDDEIFSGTGYEYKDKTVTEFFGIYEDSSDSLKKVLRDLCEQYGGMNVVDFARMKEE